MYIIIDCTDNPQGKELRPSLRDKHLAHLATVQDKILTAGPKLNANNEPIGSLLIIDFDSLDEARRFASHDPYHKGGVFETVTFAPYKQVFPPHP